MANIDHESERAAWAAVEVGRDVLGPPDRFPDYMAEWRLPGGLVVNIHRLGKAFTNVLAAGGPVTEAVQLDLETGRCSPGIGPRNSNHAAEIKAGPTLATRVRLDQLGLLDHLLRDLVRGQVPSHPSTVSPNKLPQENIEMTRPAMPRNIILYGPPGTGKTYETAALALELCGLPQSGDRGTVMKAYAQLVSDERIAFVTFHQSYGYEQFVEGLQPKTGSVDGEADGDGPGFRLEAEAGVFKRLADKARVSSNSGLDLTSEVDGLKAKRIFKMSLGRADQSEVYQKCMDEGLVLLGWGGDEDWSDPKYVSYDEVFKRGRELDPKATGNSGHISQLWALRGNMRIGDLVVVSDGNSRFRAIGEITGDYEFQPSPDGFNHRRTVRWLKVFDQPLDVATIFDGLFTMRSLYQLDHKRLKRERLAGLLNQRSDAHEQAPLQPHVIIIDEINRANVSKVFGELITLIEPDKRQGMPNALEVTLPYSKEPFSVPANLHIIGTMNTADRSIALLDTALRRRFEFRELMPKPELLPVVEGLDLRAMLQLLNDRIEYLFDRDHQIGHAFFMGCRTRKDVDQVMREKVIPLLVEYFYEDWEKVRQALGETADDGQYISRTKLRRPGGLDDEFDDTDRWRYEVKAKFEDTSRPT